MMEGVKLIPEKNLQIATSQLLLTKKEKEKEKEKEKLKDTKQVSGPCGVLLAGGRRWTVTVMEPEPQLHYIHIVKAVLGSPHSSVSPFVRHAIPTPRATASKLCPLHVGLQRHPSWDSTISFLLSQISAPASNKPPDDIPTSIGEWASYSCSEDLLCVFKQDKSDYTINSSSFQKPVSRSEQPAGSLLQGWQAQPHCLKATAGISLADVTKEGPRRRVGVS